MPASSYLNLRLPENFRKSLRSFAAKRPVFSVLRAQELSTVCEEARCPNIGECFSNKTATFMIMGDRCTRRCKFCSVITKKPLPLDDLEPIKVANAAQALNLDYVVITSVDRDDLPDFGAEHFVKVIDRLKLDLPAAKIEILTPDFRKCKASLDLISNSGIDVFGHNIESVPRLYKKLRPQSDFDVSKDVLKYISSQNKVLVKSGMMVGVGETDLEVLETMTMLQKVGVSIVTIGQYLRPSLSHWPVERYLENDSYKKFVAHGRRIGLKHVFAGPFVRSSYRAKEAYLAAVRSAASIARI